MHTITLLLAAILVGEMFMGFGCFLERLGDGEKGTGVSEPGLEKQPWIHHLILLFSFPIV